MVTVPHKMVKLMRMLEYRDVRLERFHCIQCATVVVGCIKFGGGGLGWHIVHGVLSLTLGSVMWVSHLGFMASTFMKQCACVCHISQSLWVCLICKS